MMCLGAFQRAHHYITHMLGRHSSSSTKACPESVGGKIITASQTTVLYPLDDLGLHCLCDNDSQINVSHPFLPFLLSTHKTRLSRGCIGYATERKVKHKNCTLQGKMGASAGSHTALTAYQLRRSIEIAPVIAMPMRVLSSSARLCYLHP